MRFTRSDGDYLNRVGREPLLTPQEELHLARMVQRRLELLEQQGDGDEEAWAQRCGIDVGELRAALRRGLRARNRMVAANIRLATAEASKAANGTTSMEFADLIQEAALGLARAAERFDPSRGYKFSTYAYWWVRQAIKRSVTFKDLPIRIPCHIADGDGRAKRVIEKAAREGRKLTPSQVAEEAKISPQCWEAAKAASGVMSLNFMVGADRSTELGDLVTDEDGPDVLQDIDDEMRREAINKVIDSMPGDIGLALRLHYGLDGEPLSFVEIGRRLGKGHESTRQSIQKHKPHLADELKKRGITG